MLLNLFVALSNFTCVYPIYTSFKSHDYITTMIISFVSLFSFLSHLFENHKHGMKGIIKSKKISYILNRLDVLGCIFVIIRFGYLYYIKYGLNFLNIIYIKLFLSFVFNIISEY